MKHFLLLFCTAGLVFANEPNDDWPNWRGVNYNSTVDVGALDFGENQGLKVAWKQPLGSGYSSVSVADGRAVTMFSDGTFDHAIAFDAHSGDELWRFKIDSTYKGHDGSHDGPISTPLIDGDKVFVLGPKGHLFALDVASGEKIWQSDLKKDHDSLEPLYGYATNPILFGTTLVVETGGKNGNAVSGFDTNTGEVLWTAGTDTVQYQSPTVFEFDGGPQLLAVGQKRLAGIDPRTGAMLWEYRTGGQLGHLNPVVTDSNRIFLHYKWSESKLIEVKKNGDEFAIEEIWTSRNIKGTYNVPVYHDGYLYGYSGTFLTCLDAATGKSVWKSRQPGDGFLILVDGHLVIATKTGGLHVAKASPESYQEVAGLDLFDSHAWSPPSFANGKIYARSFGAIASVEPAPVDAPMPMADEPAVPQGTEFAAFLKKLEAADDKAALIDDFMASQENFPIIENNKYVHFVYRGEANDMAMVGDIFGDRTEVPMQQVPGTDFFYLSTELKPDARVSYGFVRDFEEQATDTLNTEKVQMVFGARSLVTMPEWQAPAHLTKPDHDRRGRLDSLRLESKILEGSKRLDIYLPAGYEDSARRYPVAYVHWGALAQQWGKYKNTLDNVIGESVTPVIVVFIPQKTQGRGQEWLGDLKEKYAQMFVEEIVPLIDETYRTLPEPEARANIASGFAGWQAWYPTFKYPGVFGKVGGQSTFMLTQHENEFRPLITNAKEQPLDIYLDWAHYDYRSEVEAWDAAETCADLTALLRDRGYEVATNVTNRGYGWVFWRDQTDKMFETLFPLSESKEKNK